MDCFSYGRVQNVKLLGRTENTNACASAVTSASATAGLCATVAFMDIKSASKAHNAEHVLDERTLTTEYYEPAAIPTSAAGAPSAGSSPAGSGYSGSSSSVNSTPAPASSTRQPASWVYLFAMHVDQGLVPPSVLHIIWLPQAFVQTQLRRSTVVPVPNHKAAPLLEMG